MAEFSFDHPIFSRRLPLRPPAVLPYELVGEILRWLPVKSLMRFKCVSRIWLSIITDPSFAVIYRGGFRGLILSQYAPRFDEEKKTFFNASLDFKGRSSYSYQLSRELIVDHHGKAMGCTEIVNGLLCFYYREYSYLFNPATREKLQLPSSAVVDASKYKACSYHLGYDRVNKLYKLLKICPVYDDYPDDDYTALYADMDFVQHLNCEIISIGVDSSWRILDCYPPTEIMFQSRCVSGVLYWLEMRPDSSDERLNRLVAFDLVEEKFKLIPTPAPDPDTNLNRLMFAPGLALTSRENYVSDTIYHYCDGIWKQQKVRLPTYVRYPGEPAGILPSGEVLISHLGFLGYPAYLYDPSKEKLLKLHRTASSFNMHRNFNVASYHEENIISLKSLLTG